MRQIRRLFIWFVEIAGGALFAALAGWFTVNFLVFEDELINTFLRLAVYMFSTATGVYIVGGLMEQDGSFWFAFLGGALGGTVTWVVAGSQAVSSASLIDLVADFYSSLALVGPILATIGFNLGLRDRVR